MRQNLSRDFDISSARVKRVYDSLGECLKSDRPLDREVLFNSWLALSDVYNTLSILSRKKLVMD